jgi:DNA-binding LytR/AlgR family response regulator
MKCLIVDDEPLARALLQGYVAELGTLDLVASCGSGIQALEVLKKDHVDVLFLDVNMPKLSGIELLRVMDRRPAVILTTAYPDYALQGYELDVVDYLLKPFSFERFLRAVQKAEVRVEGAAEVQVGKTLLVRSDKRTWPIDSNEVLYIEAIGDYVQLFTRQRKVIVHDTLRSMESMLPANQFIRVHKSWIVSRQAIDFIEGNFIMCGNQSIPIGKTFKDSLMKWIE